MFSIFDVHFCNKSLESHLFTVYFNLLSDYLAIGCILCWTWLTDWHFDSVSFMLSNLVSIFFSFCCNYSTYCTYKIHPFDSLKRIDSFFQESDYTGFAICVWFFIRTDSLESFIRESDYTGYPLCVWFTKRSWLLRVIYLEITLHLLCLID